MNKKIFVILGLLILISVSLRVYNFRGRGVMNYDESYYLREAQFIHSVFYNLPEFIKLIKDKNISVQDLRSKIQGLPPAFTPKPMHSLMLGVFGILFGVHDYLGIIYSVFFSSLNIILLYFMMKTFEDNLTSIVACVISIYSLFELAYSRTSYPEISGVTFMLAAVYMLFRENKLQIFRAKKHILIGIFFALMTATNYRTLFIFIFFLCLFFYFKPADIFKRLFFTCSSFVLTLCIFEFPYFIVRIFKPFPPGFYSYFEMLFKWYFKTHNPIGVSYYSKLPIFYPHTAIFNFLINGESIIYSAAFFVSIIFLLIHCRKKKEQMAIVVLAVLPILLFSLTSRGNRPVTFTSTIPFMSAVIAIGLKNITQKFFTNYEKPYLFTVILIIVFAAPKIYNEITVTSGYNELSTFLKKNGIYHHFTTNNSHSQFYLGRDAGNYPPITIQEYDSTEYYKNINIFAADFFYYTDKFERREVEDFIVKNGELLYTINNDWVGNSVTFLDMYKTFFTQKHILKEPLLNTIKVYRFNPALFRLYLIKNSQKKN